MSRILIIHNPRSRRGAQCHSNMKRWLEAGGHEDGVEFAEVTELENVALPDDRLVVAGGDGTINSALEWLYARGGSCPVGLVPAGTANCLAAGFGLNLKDAEACETAFLGTEKRPLDILTYRVPEEDRTRLILQSSSLGLPSNVGISYERLRQNWFWRLLFRLLGNASYNLLAFFEIRSQRRRERRNEPVLSMKIVFPPEETKPDFEGDVLALFLHNEPTIGGNLVPCPKARMDDGLMDLCIFRSSRSHSYLGMLRKLGQGSHLEEKDVVVYHQTAGPLQVSLSLSQPFNSDGDIWLESSEFEFALDPARFDILVAK
ncbi:MAG: diacylglycerol kinase family protein [Planctomycetota bacterium]|nr:diacylglycerol kinase family protein [Planctomycetota bacterium]